MRSARICSDHKSSGLTLVELLTAMAIIPVILIAATTISLQAAQTAQATDQDSKAVAEMENVMSTISRIVENGTPSKIDSNNAEHDTEVFQISNCNGIGLLCDALRIRIPNAQPRVFKYNPADKSLQTCTQPDEITECSANDWINISYNKTIQTSPGVPPFEYPFNGNIKQVQINFEFAGHNNETHRSSQVINLNGGSGVL